jgi:hypothetical protein
MNASTSLNVALAFTSEWQAWLALRHLLPARIQRDLVLHVLDEVSEGQLSVSQLFEEVSVAEPLWNECWAVRPIQGAKGAAARLQEWLRAIVWQNDDHHALDSSGEMPEGAYPALPLLGVVTRLGSGDLGSLDRLDEIRTEYGDRLQPTLRSLLAAFEIAKEGHGAGDPDSLWERLAEVTADVPMPLRAIMIKHIADLLGDADAWSPALRGYALATSFLTIWEEPSELCDVKRAWKGILLHSGATATAIVQGEHESAREYLDAAQVGELTADPLSAMNIGVDAARAWSVAEESYRDPRVAFLAAPLVLGTHEVGVALRYWANGKHRDASRRFWALLRRQIALGAGQEAQATKAAYARNIFADVTEQVDNSDGAAQFLMAANLLIESGRPDVVGRIAWERTVVQAYATRDGVVAGLVSRANAHAGARIARTRVLVELFKTWAKQLSPMHDAVTLAMWGYIAQVALDFEAEFTSDMDVGRPALKGLLELAKRRPELRERVAEKTARSICARLQGTLKWGQAEAIEAARAYLEAFDPDALRQVVVAVLETLEAEDPRAAFWPLSRAGLRLLVDHRVRERCRGDAEIDTRSLEQILRFGLADEDDGKPVVFFHLADFDASLLEQAGVAGRLQKSLSAAMRGALQKNSTAVTDHIQALLVAPTIAGPEGIRTAIKGISGMLASVSTTHPSLGLSSLDRVLLVLTEQLGAIRQLSLEWLDAELHGLIDAIIRFWDEASRRPIVLAPFALPPRTKASEVLVHNCAFACLRFSREVGEEARVLEALAKAGENPELANAIILARATRVSGAELAEDDLEIPQVEDRDAFYPTVGRRLAQLQRLPRQAALALCRGLVQNTLRLGPDPADAALLLAAANLDLHDFVRECGLENYLGRVRADRSNRLLLQPIVELFRSEDS